MSGDQIPKSSIESISNWETTKGKRALLCGVTYNKHKYKHKGSVYDVFSMRLLLFSRFQFPLSSIRILAELDTYPHPTKRNIQEALRWLVKDNQSGDSLVFYFSGRGLRQRRNLSNDGFDEALCPSDYTTAGMIFDNEINDTIVRPLKDGVKLHAIIEASYSGRILDLPHVYSTEKNVWMGKSSPSGINKGISGGHAISISACQHDQLAEDVRKYSEDAFKLSGTKHQSIMTYVFQEAVTNAKVTYAHLLDAMPYGIRYAKKKCFIRGLFHSERLQVS